MEQVTHFKPNVCYEIAIHGVYHYVGCHTQGFKSFLTEKEILIGSGNYLRTQINKTITRQEYYDCVELIKVWEFDDKQSALDFEVKQIQECKRVYKDLCVNKALYGNKSGGKGVEWSEEHKNNLSKSNRNNPKQNCKKVRQYTMEGVLKKEYPSLREAYRQTGIENIGKCCQGQYRSAGGFIWKYA